VVGANGTILIIAQILTNTPSGEQNLHVQLYPNPVTNNQLNINFAETAGLTLYDARGQVLYSKANLIGELTLPVSLKRGMYVARIAGAAGSWNEKVVVE